MMRVWKNLRSFFMQDYPEYEVVLAVHRADDPAVPIAEKIINEFSGRVKARLIVTGLSGPQCQGLQLEPDGA